jgi:hypothetical protein
MFVLFVRYDFVYAIRKLRLIAATKQYCSPPMNLTTSRNISTILKIDEAVPRSCSVVVEPVITFHVVVTSLAIATAAVSRSIIVAMVLELVLVMF